MKIGNHLGFFVWAGVVAAIGLGFWSQIRQGLTWETDILTLLPVTEQDPVAEGAVNTFTRRIGKKTIFLVGHPDLDTAVDAATAFAQKLEQSSAFENVVFDTGSLGERAFFDLYFPHRFLLLSEETRELLRSETGGQRLVRRATETLYSPMTAAVSGYLEDDPLLLFPEFLKGFPKPPTRLEIHEGRMLIRQEETAFFLITADLLGSAFSAQVQEKTVGEITQFRKALQTSHEGVRLLTTGVIYYAHAGTQSAKGEISTIGVGSVLGIILLLLLVFRSLRPLLLSLLPLGVGCLTALCFSFWWFGQLHLLTLVFGASLIGVCIDYSFHFFCEFYFSTNRGSPRGALKHILPGITLGAITSVLGYLGLLFAPFPGLKQMAVFSSLGLVGAFGTVVFWFPVLTSLGRAQPSSRQSLLRARVNRYIDFWRGSRFSTSLLVLAVPVVGAVWVLTHLRADDDIRLLQTQPKQLVEQEEKIRRWIGGVDTSRFLLVEGDTIESMLENAEQVHPSLEKIRADGGLGFFQGLYQWVPSRAKQMENQKLLRDALLQGDVLSQYLNEMAFEPDRLEMIAAALDPAKPTVLEFSQWLASPASLPFRHLWLGETSRGVASMLLLGNVANEAALEDLAGQHAGVTYIDKVSDVSGIFKRYRILASKLVLLAYGVILILLCWRYGLRKGLRVMLPPLLAAGFALALVATLGLAINLFSMLALLLVLGIGIDYTIFLAESSEGTTMMAIVLSSMTTILSFGLLALSATPVLRSFGLTLLLGIGFAMLLAPLVVCGIPRDQSKAVTE